MWWPTSEGQRHDESAWHDAGLKKSATTIHRCFTRTGPPSAEFVIPTALPPLGFLRPADSWHRNSADSSDPAEATQAPVAASDLPFSGATPEKIPSEGISNTLRGTNYSLGGTNYSLEGSNYSLEGSNYSLRGSNYSLRGTNCSLRGTNYSLRGSKISLGGIKKSRRTPN